MGKTKRMVLVHTSKNGKPIKFPKFPGRNDLCNCGSGKKYKNCHLPIDNLAMRTVK